METSSADPRIQPLEPGARVGPACGRPAWALSVLNYRPLNPKSQPPKSLYSKRPGIFCIGSQGWAWHCSVFSNKVSSGYSPVLRTATHFCGLWIFRHGLLFILILYIK